MWTVPLPAGLAAAGVPYAGSIVPVLEDSQIQPLDLKSKELKQKIESNGIGNSKSSNALTDIYNSLK